MNNLNKNIDLTGFRHERLLVIKKAEEGRSKWVCKCDCGKELVLYTSHVLSRKSCGCLYKEKQKELPKYTTKHGKTNTILYSKYCSMKYRCYNPNYKYFWRYGSRGIKVCDEWLGENGFSNFYKWAYENGYDNKKKGYEQTLDRIDVDGNYEPSNCRWATQKEQSRNTSVTTHIYYKNECITIPDFCEYIGIKDVKYVRRKVKRGESAEEIIHDWKLKRNSDYMTVAESMKYYGVCQRTILNWIRHKKIIADQSGGAFYVLKNQPRPT